MSRRNSNETWLPFGVFGDVWRAALLQGRGLSSSQPAPLEAVYASRFAAPTQPSAAAVSTGKPVKILNAA